MGLVAVLIMVLAAFEWTSSEINLSENLFIASNDGSIEEIIPITKPEPVKKPEIPKIVEIKIVPDDVEDIPDLKVFDPEVNLDDSMDYTMPEPDPDPEIPMPVGYYFVEEKPEFKGGETEMFRFIQKNTVYPEVPKSNGVEEVIYVGFVIETDGTVSEVKLLRGEDPFLVKEALRVVNLMPKWSAGKQQGVPVRVSFQLPIRFKLY
ncbi:MAG: TonB family protein [Proteobacteria bacterium]|nr:TonB family protein [Pseudomonadota bacterium]